MVNKTKNLQIDKEVIDQPLTLQNLLYRPIGFHKRIGFLLSINVFNLMSVLVLAFDFSDDICLQIYQILRDEEQAGPTCPLVTTRNLKGPILDGLIVQKLR